MGGKVAYKVLHNTDALKLEVDLNKWGGEGWKVVMMNTLQIMKFSERSGEPVVVTTVMMEKSVG